MLSHRSTIAALALASLLALVGCGGPPRQKTIYWHGERWDGMNRMVFALQDLGWHLDTVDTETGRIVATMPRDVSGDSGAQGPGGDVGEPDAAGREAPAPPDEAGMAAERFYSIVIQFPQDPGTPVAIGPADGGDSAYQSKKFLRLLSEITRRFEWYGGSSVEVVG